MEKLKEKQNRKKEKKQVSESQTPSPQPPKITPITIGEHVKIKGQSAIGEVLEINGKNTAVVGFGSIKTTVKLDRLERTNAAPQKQEPAKVHLSVARRTTRCTKRNLASNRTSMYAE